MSNFRVVRWTNVHVYRLTEETHTHPTSSIHSQYMDIMDANRHTDFKRNLLALCWRLLETDYWTNSMTLKWDTWSFVTIKYWITPINWVPRRKYCHCDNPYTLCVCVFICITEPRCAWSEWRQLRAWQRWMKPKHILHLNPDSLD